MLCRCIGYSCVCKVHSSPALSESLVTEYFKWDDASYIYDGIKFDLYPRLVIFMIVHFGENQFQLT